MRFSVFLFLFAGLVLTSCRHRPEPVHSLLIYADSLMEEHADSALCYLQSLDVSELSDADLAYYGLQLTQASDKNFLPLLSCDSLVDAALDYYEEGDGLLRAKALLYKGRIHQSMNMPEEAMQNCFVGLSELGNTLPELRLKSMFYDDLGSIYQDQLLGTKALEMYRLSSRCDSLLDDKRLLMHSLSNIGWANVLLHKKKIADKYLNSALELAFDLKDSLFIADVYCKLSDNSENVDSTLFYVRLSQRYQKKEHGAIVFMTLGDIFMEKQELDSAEYYLKKVLASSDFKRQVLVYRLLSELEKKKGDYQNAYRYSMFYQDNVDSIFALNQASNIERLAYKYESELKVLNEKARTENIIEYTVFSFFVIFLLFLLILQRIRRRRKIAKLVFEQAISHLNRQIALQQCSIERSKEDLRLLKQAQQQDKEEIAHKEQEIRRMTDEKAKLRNWFFMQTSIYKRIDELARQGNLGKEARILLQPEQQLLKETIMQIYDEYVQYLHSTYPKLTEDDCIYCCLQLCRLDDQTIAYCFGNTSRQIVAQRRLRLKKRMELSF